MRLKSDISFVKTLVKGALTMTKQQINILKHCDHTLLRVDATESEIRTETDKAIKHQCASICIPTCYVRSTAKYLQSIQSQFPICTVIGFPMGYSDTYTKAHETQQAILDGAKEIDVVMNISKFKSGLYEEIKDELRFIRNICLHKSIIIKLIVEACLLTQNEKKRVCDILNNSDIDFLKTSTGFHGEGAQVEDVKLFRKLLDKNIQIKASGGIRDFETAQALLDVGATRIGESHLI